MRTYYLRTLRIRRRLSQEDLERTAEVAQNTISKLESNPNVRPTFNTVLALARALGVAPEQLRFGPDPNQPRPPRQKSSTVVSS